MTSLPSRAVHPSPERAGAAGRGGTLDGSLAHGLNTIWRRAKPTLLERVAAVEIAVAELRRTPIRDSRIETGRSASHKLAGVLGTFGLDDGTELARELEGGLSHPGAREADRLEGFAAELRELVEHPPT